MVKQIIPLLFVVCVVGCSPRIIVQRDTLCTTKEVVKEVLKDTTIYVTLPSESVSIATYDTTSFLSTKIAYSCASISNGVLRHTLENNSSYKPEIKVIYKDREVVRDSIVYIKEDVPIEVEKESWWDRTLKEAGKLFFVALAIGLIWLILRLAVK